MCSFTQDNIKVLIHKKQLNAPVSSCSVNKIKQMNQIIKHYNWIATSWTWKLDLLIQSAITQPNEKLCDGVLNIKNRSWHIQE